MKQSEQVKGWLAAIDDRTRAAALARIDRVQRGLMGDAKSLAGGVSELRIDHGPGIRIYLTRRGNVVYLLVAGRKSTQKTDIKIAKKLAAALP